jgi:hypothetical protein
MGGWDGRGGEEERVDRFGFSGMNGHLILNKVKHHLKFGFT